MWGFGWFFFNLFVLCLSCCVCPVCFGLGSFVFRGGVVKSSAHSLNKRQDNNYEETEGKRNFNKHVDPSTCLTLLLIFVRAGNF